MEIKYKKLLVSENFPQIICNSLSSGVSFVESTALLQFCQISDTGFLCWHGCKYIQTAYLKEVISQNLTFIIILFLMDDIRWICYLRFLLTLIQLVRLKEKFWASFKKLWKCKGQIWICHFLEKYLHCAKEGKQNLLNLKLAADSDVLCLTYFVWHTSTSLSM